MSYQQLRLKLTEKQRACDCLFRRILGQRKLRYSPVQQLERSIHFLLHYVPEVPEIWFYVQQLKLCTCPEMRNTTHSKTQDVHPNAPARREGRHTEGFVNCSERTVWNWRKCSISVRRSEERISGKVEVFAKGMKLIPYRIQQVSQDGIFH